MRARFARSGSDYPCCRLESTKPPGPRLLPLATVESRDPSSQGLQSEKSPHSKSLDPMHLANRCQRRESPDNRPASKLLQAKAGVAHRSERASLFRRDNGMVGLACCECQNRVNVRAFKVGVFLQNRLSRLAGRQETENISNSDTQVANTRTAVHAARVYCYSGQKFGHLKQ